DFLLYHTTPARRRLWPPDLDEQPKPAAGAFVGNGAGQLYSQGALGLTMADGGTGIAERRYLETVAFAQRRLRETSAWALKQLPWDLFLAYLPFPDEAEHRWR